MSKRNVKIVNVPGKWDYFEDALLNDEELLRDLPSSVVEIYYSYGSASYEGTGNAILVFKDGGFDVVGLGHCSCNGPTDDFSSAESSFNLVDLGTKRFSKDYKEELEGLVAALKKSKVVK